MAPAPTGHSEVHRTNFLVYLVWEDGPIPFQAQPRPFLAFAADEISCLQSAPVAFELKGAIIAILGCKGSLLAYDGVAAVPDVTGTVDFTVGKCALFIPDVTQDTWMESMVPFTELHQAGTSKSGTSASTSSSLWRPLPSQTGLEHGLETDFKGVTHQLQFSQQSRGERQYLLSEALKEADGNCQMTGHPKADATHLLKKTNPDVSAVHIAAVRGHLYPDLRASAFQNFTGSHDTSLAFRLHHMLHKKLDSNRIFFQASSDTMVTLLATSPQHKVEALNLSHRYEEYDYRSNTVCAQSAGFTFGVEREDRTMNTWKLWWDWQLGARILARFGTTHALDLSRRSILVTKVAQWQARLHAA